MTLAWAYSWINRRQPNPGEGGIPAPLRLSVAKDSGKEAGQAKVRSRPGQPHRRTGLELASEREG